MCGGGDREGIGVREEAGEGTYMRVDIYMRRGHVCVGDIHVWETYIWGYTCVGVYMWGYMHHLGVVGVHTCGGI